MPDEISRKGANDFIQISRAELERMIDDHCDVRLSAFGIDWQSTEGTREFIEDMLFLRRFRNTMQNAHRVGFIAVVTTTVSGILALIWMAIKNKTP
jgi:hypothetical protein